MKIPPEAWQMENGSVEDGSDDEGVEQAIYDTDDGHQGNCVADKMNSKRPLTYLSISD
jgi:hypothetical protein